MKLKEENIKKLREGKVTLVADHGKPDLMRWLIGCYYDDGAVEYNYFYMDGENGFDACKEDGLINYQKGELMPLKEFFIEDESIFSNRKPKRYASREVNGMDVIDLTEHWNLNFQEANILKYLLRDKGQDYEDMLKIVDYATREAELIKKRNS